MEGLKTDLERSSINNRHLLIFYLLALTYFLTIVISTTDLMLLVPESSLKLPVIGAELNLLKFYIFAPFIVILIHFHLLFCLFHHSKLLKAWQKVCTEAPNSCHPERCRKNPAGVWHFPPFLFNHLICPLEYPSDPNNNRHQKDGKVNKRLTYYLVRLLTWIVIYFFPLFLLVFFQWRFADYRNLKITFFSHFTTTVIDFLLLFYYWRQIIDLVKVEEQEIKPEEKGIKPKKQDIFPKYVFFHLVKKLFSWAYEKIRYCYQNAGILNTLVFVLLSIFQVLTFGVILAPDVLPYNLAYRWIREYNLPVPRLKITAQDVVSGLLNSKNGEHEINFQNHFHLTLEQLECGRDPIKLAEGRYKNWRPCKQNKKQADCPNQRDERFFGKRLNLKDRDLRFADFSAANLDMADLSGAKLQGCNLRNSHLRGALLHGARLQRANLQNAQLWCADLSNADLQSASLQSVDLQKAILDKANFDGADLTNVNLYGSYLHRTSMNGAVLFKADASHISAGNINAVAADLSNASFEDAVMYDANLTLANLESSVLRRAKFIGANLKASNQKKVDLAEANLVDTNLMYADLRAANLEETDFSGARLQHSRLKGAKWIADHNFSGAQMFNVSISEKDVILSKNTEEIAADRCNEYEELLEKCKISESFMSFYKEFEGSNEPRTEQKSDYNFSFTCNSKADAELVTAPKGQDNFMNTCAVAKKVHEIICSDVSAFSQSINESIIDKSIKTCKSPEEIMIDLKGVDNLDNKNRNRVANKIMKDFFNFKYFDDENSRAVKEHFEQRGVRFDSPKVPREIAEHEHSMQVLRQEFACNDFYIAKGVFRQLLFDKQMEWARESLYMHMNANCPEIANFILPP